MYSRLRTKRSRIHADLSSWFSSGGLIATVQVSQMISDERAPWLACKDQTGTCRHLYTRVHPHTNYVTTVAVQSIYALRVLRAHGLSGPNLWDVTRATAVAKLTYACSAWWGYVDSGGKARIQSVLNKLKRLGFLAEYISFDQICLERDTQFFSQILTNLQHVLHQLLPPVRNVPYSLCPRVHDRELPVVSAAMRKNFIIRMLFLDTY